MMLLVAALSAGALFLQVRGLQRGDAELRLLHSTIRSRAGQIAFACLNLLFLGLVVLLAFVG